MFPLGRAAFRPATARIVEEEFAMALLNVGVAVPSGRGEKVEVSAEVLDRSVVAGDLARGE